MSATSPADLSALTAVSPVDGATYQFHAVCENTSYGYTATSSAHTVAELGVSHAGPYSPLFRLFRSKHLTSAIAHHRGAS